MIEADTIPPDKRGEPSIAARNERSKPLETRPFERQKVPTHDKLARHREVTTCDARPCQQKAFSGAVESYH